MEYRLFIVFMMGSLLIYGLMFWMWIEKWVSLELILGVVTLKFVITVMMSYGLKAQKILEKHRRHLKNETSTPSALNTGSTSSSSSLSDSHANSATETSDKKKD